MVHRIEQLLRALDPVMAENGGIKCSEDIGRVVTLMRDMTKLESRCVYLNLILATKNESFLRKFVNAGGWKIMNQWLADITADPKAQAEKEPALDCNVFIEDVLRALKMLPVSIEILKQNATPRLVKNLSKDSKMSTNVQSLASEVVECWMSVIKSPSNEVKSPNNAANTKSPVTSHFVIPKKSQKDKSQDSPVSSSNIANQDTKESLGKEDKKIDAQRKRPSASDEKKSSAGQSSEKKGVDISAPKAKKKKKQDANSNCVDKVNTSVDIISQIKVGMNKTKHEDISPTDVTASRKKVPQNKSKKPPQIRQISLVDDIFKPAETVSPVKKKKKHTPTSVVNLGPSPFPSMSKSSDKNKAADSPVVCKKIEAEASKDDKDVCPSNVSRQLSTDSKKSSSSENESTKVKNANGKCVKWRPDEELVFVKVYELDDEERAVKSLFVHNSDQDAVDSLRESLGIAKREMLLEKKIRQQQVYSGSAPIDSTFGTVDNICWKLVEVTVSEEMKTSRGSLSTEKHTQNAREKVVLSEFYPNLLTVPKSPREPDLCESFKATKDPIIIPYDDIEPQGMDIDNSDEDEKIFHRMFPDAAKLKLSENGQKRAGANVPAAVNGNAPALSQSNVSNSSPLSVSTSSYLTQVAKTDAQKLSVQLPTVSPSTTTANPFLVLPSPTALMGGQPTFNSVTPTGALSLPSPHATSPPNVVPPFSSQNGPLVSPLASNPPFLPFQSQFPAQAPPVTFANNHTANFAFNAANGTMPMLNTNVPGSPQFFPNQIPLHNHQQTHQTGLNWTTPQNSANRALSYQNKPAPSFQVVCRFFQQGHCNHGNNCRYIHSSNTNGSTVTSPESATSRSNQSRFDHRPDSKKRSFDPRNSRFSSSSRYDNSSKLADGKDSDRRDDKRKDNHVDSGSSKSNRENRNDKSSNFSSSRH